MHHRSSVRAACLALAALASLTACTADGGDDGGEAAPRSLPTRTEPVETEPGADGAGDPYYPDDGNGGYDVEGYHVSISYQPGTRRLDGDTVVTATATGDLTTFNLDLHGLTVDSVEVAGQPAEFTREGEHELVITPPEPVEDGATFETRVRYAGVPAMMGRGALGENGWHVASSGGAFVAGQPHSATSWYPANDTPKDKATFRLDARVPNGWSVVSNGVEQAPTRGSDGWTTFHWREPNRVATYLTTVGIDKWTFERSTLPGGTPVVSAYAPGAEDKRQVEARLPEIIEFLESKFGPYPQSAAGGIYVNESIGFSLETQGRPIYADWAQLPVVVHENAHQWYGNSVSVSSWADICLNECFASYAQWLWEEEKEGVDLDARYRTEVARSAERLWQGELYDMGAGNEFSAVYEKGPLALHALRRQIGDEAFDRLLREWPERHRDGNASWPEFERLTQDIAGQGLTGFLLAWFHDGGKPADEYLYPGSLRR
ncbi:M1 family metallopeptidase [Actinophytocola gossypii]|uniref:Aminopeptidase N n=1 Tax=Actinophytocola gossypii TaxID=2812003 RepID=A0ABT2J4P1_9PSEU|nr:M1 family metallopeptidase [Actinophytocola gossypii]MCT2582559.1 M1 family metallopeptidase [Actinophytocola gossypii]